ncbi:MJ1255/VC2487 family glycosyltransferase [Marinicellulosiphila megalodicopiae]|uniref:MJ1255/VC2487 family glycosyltransferase n=1 Tax=Marinicellulosiphila megalodicopiae TaxID=2724896 RepID=UPI003BAFF4E6
MNILYAVQGTGNGHISRARSIVGKLKEQGASVDFVFSGRDNKEDYFDMEEFGDFKALHGVRLCMDKGRLNILKTITTFSYAKLKKEIKSLDLSKYDLVLTDFEPISAWAAKQQNVPCVAIGHQYSFGYDVPCEGDSLLSRFIFKYYAPADRHIGFHWHHYNAPILPPLIHIIDKKIQASVVKTNQCLVYLVHENSQEMIVLLQQLPEIQFVYHCKDIDPGIYANVTVKPFSREGFQRSLLKCNYIITGAGFEFPSEALQLGKSIMVKPVKGQMEQLSNAKALTQLGYATRIEKWDIQTIRDWYQSSEQVKVSFPDITEDIAKWVIDPNFESIDSITKRLWKEVKVSKVEKEEEFNLSAILGMA